MSTFSVGSFDPILTVPIEEGVTVFAAIQDQSNDFGENIFYEALFTSIKPPVEYNLTEEEYLDNQVSNDGLLSGQELEDGDRVFGTISSIDRDWYFVDLPPGEQNLELTIEKPYASPADLKISLFPPETLMTHHQPVQCVRNNGSPLSSSDPFAISSR